MASMLFACAPESIPVEKAGSPGTVPSESKTTEKMSWELEWEKTLAAAKKEGIVVVYGSSQLAQARIALSKVFKDKFGIGIDITTGRSSENAEKMLSQRRAGGYLVDAINSGTA